MDFDNFKKFKELSEDVQQAVAKLPSEGNNSLTKQYLIVDDPVELAKMVSNARRLVNELDLGKFVKKIGDYEVYEKGEVFFRGMSYEDYVYLVKEGKIRAPLNSPNSEVFTSPTLEYIQSVGYGGDGVIVMFKMKPGTLDNLIVNGVRDESKRTKSLFPSMESINISGWEKRGKVYFKQETIKETRLRQVNIGLGKKQDGGLQYFNGVDGANILEFK